LKKAEVVCLLSAAAVSGLFGTFEQLSGFHLGNFRYLQGTGFFSGPMAFAGQMQLFSFLAIGIAMSGGAADLWPAATDRAVPEAATAGAGPVSARLGSARRMWFFSTLVATVLGLIFACERSAWLGFAVSVVMVACLVSWRVMAKVMVAGLLMACLAWFTVPVVQTRLTPLLHPQQDASMRGRMKVWETACSLFIHDGKSILIGVGPTHFPHVYLDEAVVPGIKVKDYLDHAHSNYLQMLSTSGILGLISYLWLSLASIRLTWINYRAGVGFERGLALGIMGGLISLMVAGIFEYNFGTGQVRMAQWFLLSLLAAAPLSAATGTTGGTATGSTTAIIGDVDRNGQE
jgi:O-antigen ligase